MKTIRSYGNVAEAGFAQSLLQAAGIDASLVDENAAAIGLNIRLQAPEEEVERALAILDGQAGLNYQSTDVQVGQSDPTEHEAETPVPGQSTSLNITCPNCGTQWELTPDEAEKDEFTFQECETTFPIHPDLKDTGFRAMRVILAFVLVVGILLALAIAVHIVRELFPHNAYVYYCRGISKQHNGDLDGAMADFNSAIALDPEYGAAYCARGLIKSIKGDVDGAVVDYNQAIVFDPNESVTYYDRALEEAKKGDLTGAMADFNQAIALNRHRVEFYWGRGSAELEQGDLDQAMADYNQAIALDPLRSKPYFLRGSVKRAEGDFDGAIADDNRAIALDPLEAEGYLYRGAVKRDQGDSEGAIVDYNRAISLNPKKPSAYLARGFIRGVKGDVDRALADDNRAIAFDSKYAAAYKNRGNTYSLMRNWAAALADYRQCCHLSLAGQDYPRLYIYLIRARLGEKEAARKELSSYIGARQKTSSNSGNWVASIAGYVLGNVTAADLFAAAASPYARKAEGRTCEAWYFGGMKKLLDGDKEGAVGDLQKCVATGRKDYVEFGFARSELKALAK